MDRFEEVKNKDEWAIDDEKWCIKEIERLKKDLDETSREADEAEWKVVDKSKEIERLADLNKAKGALIKAQAKKIWMLWKEKEWLLEAYALDVYIGNDRLDDHKLDDYKNEILEEMQQALKEG